MPIAMFSSSTSDVEKAKKVLENCLDEDLSLELIDGYDINFDGFEIAKHGTETYDKLLEEAMADLKKTLDNLKKRINGKYMKHIYDSSKLFKMLNGERCYCNDCFVDYMDGNHNTDVRKFMKTLEDSEKNYYDNTWVARVELS